VLLDVEELLPPLLEATYDQPLRPDQVTTVRRLCPEVDWLAQCAASAPLPLGWKASMGSDAKPQFENHRTGEVLDQPPWLPDFGYLARLILHVRMDASEARRVGALLVTERDRCRQAVQSLQKGWSGPHRDRFTGQHFYHCQATGTSAWQSPAAPAEFQLKVVEMLMSCRLFDIGAVTGPPDVSPEQVDAAYPVAAAACAQVFGAWEEGTADSEPAAAWSQEPRQKPTLSMGDAVAQAAEAPAEQFDIFTEGGSPRAEAAGDLSMSFFGGSFLNPTTQQAEQPTKSVAEAAAAVASAAAALAGMEPKDKIAAGVNAGDALRTLKQATQALQEVSGAMSARGESKQLEVTKVQELADGDSSSSSSSSSDSEADTSEPEAILERPVSKTGVPSKAALSDALQINVDALSPPRKRADPMTPAAANTPLRAVAAASGPACFDIADSPPNHSTLNDSIQAGLQQLEIAANGSTPAATTPLRVAGTTLMSALDADSPPPVPPLDASLDLTLGQTAVSVCAALGQTAVSVASQPDQTLGDGTQAQSPAKAASELDMNSPPPLGKLIDDDSDPEIEYGIAPAVSAGMGAPPPPEALPTSKPASTAQSKGIRRAASSGTDGPRSSWQLGSLPPPPEGVRAAEEAELLSGQAKCSGSKGRRLLRADLADARGGTLSTPPAVGGA